MWRETMSNTSLFSLVILIRASVGKNNTNLAKSEPIRKKHKIFSY
ncbi:hypothetical protein GLYMA_13G046550v4 [Glycine max]|nr:hypothetical protein GLYMA_13G046550v4 [Glycine max]KAH1099856.1 hypothetical protein GYH30_035145 [Glycine max]